jgi:hypothetical protein
MAEFDEDFDLSQFSESSSDDDDDAVDEDEADTRVVDEGAAHSQSWTVGV